MGGLLTRPAKSKNASNARNSQDFDTLFTKARPHVLEKVCLSFDYETFKNCLEVNEAWKNVLTSKAFQKKAKVVFQKEIMEDEEKLPMRSREGNTEEVRKLLSSGMVNVDSLGKY